MQSKVTLKGIRTFFVRVFMILVFFCFADSNVLAQYCTPGITDCTLDDNILNVTFGGVNNTSTCANAATGYTDYTTNPNVATMNVNAGVPSPISVKVGAGDGQAEYVAVWIDYNQNFTFEANEYTALGSGSGVVLNGSITIPANASAGVTRMRVRVLWTSPSTSTYSCTDNGQGYGETEDYKVNIIVPQVCSGTPDAGNTLSTLYNACVGTPITLSVSNNLNLNSGYSYQWQSSTDNISYSAVTGAINNTLSSTVTVSTWYRLIVTCTNGAVSDTSVPVQVLQNPPTLCYCIPATTSCTSNDEITNVSFGAINNNSTCSATGGYTDYTIVPSVPTAQIAAGAPTPMSVTVGSGGTEYVGVWIDYNHSGTFDSTEYTLLGSGNGVAITGNITIPLTADSGLTKMRVRLRFSTALTGTESCIGYTYGETEDYNIHISLPSPCSGTPDAGNTLSSVASACYGTAITLYSSTNLNDFTGYSYQWQSSTDSIDYTPVSSVTGNILVTNLTAPKWYRLIVTCINGLASDTSTPVHVLQNPASLCYCTPATTSCASNDVITNVTVGGINNNSTCGTGGYSDYTTDSSVPTAQILAGAPAPISVTVGTGGTEYVGVWVDYNHSGTFDSTEYTLIGSGNGVAVTGNITVPVTADSGLTKMRVRLRWFTALTGVQSCIGYTYGETEDYNVYITLPPPCSGTPNAGNTLSSVPSICLGSTFTLSVSNNLNLNSGYTYQWQSSSDSINFTDIQDANNNTLTTTLTDSTWYQLIVYCTASLQYDTSSPVLVRLNLPNQCYCTPASTNCSLRDVITNVTLDVINNTSTCSASGGYTNYVNDTTINTPYLYAGVRYPMSVTVGAGGTEYVGVWIDYDQSGTFDASEFTSFGSGTSAAVNGFVNIPSGAVQGVTRMRVRLRYATALTGTDACSTYTYGETEDYKVNIILPIPCSGTPDAGNTIASTDTACRNVSFNLSVSNNLNYYSGLTYQWQSSSDDVTYSNITSANSNLYSTNISATKYFRLVVTCNDGGNSDTSTSVRVVYGSAQIIDQPDSVTSISCGNADTLTAVVSGVNITLQWQVKTNPTAPWVSVSAADTNFVGANTAQLIVPQAVDYMNGYIFRLKVRSRCDTLYSINDTLRVARLYASVNPPSASFCKGLSTSLTIDIDSSAVGVWTPVNGLFTNPSLTTPYDGSLIHAVYAFPNTSTTYKVVIKRSICFSDSLPVPVVVYSNPNPAIAPAPYSSLYPGLHTTLNSIVTNQSDTLIFYHWSYNGNDILTTFDSVAHVDINGFGTYSLSVTDGHGCTGTSPEITINDSLNPALFVYPNPTSGMFQISYNHKYHTLANPLSVSIYDDKAARVYSRSFTITAPFQPMNIDFRTKASGTYHIVLSDANGTILKSGRVIKIN